MRTLKITLPGPHGFTGQEFVLMDRPVKLRGARFRDGKVTSVSLSDHGDLVVTVKEMRL